MEKMVMALNKIYQLEENIMDCWRVINDLNTTLDIIDHTGCDEDAVSNAIIGIKEMYNMRFENLFNAFEEVLGEMHELREFPNTTNTTANSVVGRTTTLKF
jgi:hypothetical protein